MEAKKPLFSTISQLSGNFNALGPLYLPNETRYT